MTSAMQFHAAVRSQSRGLQLPSQLDGTGLLVGWSLEREHRKVPMGFSFGDPRVSPATGYVDPVLLDREGHLLTVAPTGAGKGVGCIIPALLRHEGPAIVIDPKGENTAITARWRRSIGQEVVVLDPMGLTGEETGALNPLDLIDTGSATGVDDAAALVEALLPTSFEDGRNRYWLSRAQQLLLGLVLHVMTDLPPEQRTLMTVRRLAAEMAGDGETVIHALGTSRHPEAQLAHSGLTIAARETLGSIVSFAQEGVDFLRGPALQAAVARTSFELDKVISGEPLTIYIVVPPHMLNSHGRFLRLWIATLLGLIVRRRRRPERATLFVLDEAAQLGTLDELRTALTLLRGYGLQTWSFWQDFSQLRLLYPRDWQTMMNNCAVLQSFGPNTHSAAKDVTEVMGFLTASEFLALSPDEMLLQITGDEGVVARRPDYRTDPAFVGRFDANPMFGPGDARPVPRPIDVHYLRSTPASISSAPHLGRLECLTRSWHEDSRLNPVDELLAQRLIEEVRGSADADV